MRKSLTSILLLVALCVCLVSCATVKSEAAAPAVEEVSALESAKAYLKVMFDKSSRSNPETRTPSDYEVLDVVAIKGVEYPVTWSTDTDLVKAVPGENHIVVIDVDEAAPEETRYILTATITDPATGETITLDIKHVLPEGQKDPSMEDIVLSAYKLADGETTNNAVTLTGVIVAIPTAYSEKYGNITVDIQIGAMADNIIQCFRLSGEGCDKLAVGDEITVNGKIKNYKGTIEFDKNCQLLKDAKAFAYLKTLKAAYALEENASLEGARVLKGVITEIPSAYSEKYGNITVNMVVNGLTDMVVQCYRLKGDGVEKLAVGDEITVGGILKNFKGTVEFDKDCILM